MIAPPRPTGAIVRRVALAWKEGAEAARAVSAAAALLDHAQKVFILSIAEHDVEGAQKGAERLAESLAWRGIATDIIAEPGAGRMSHALSRLAYGVDADVLVMGAYGHGRLREAVLGGVTEDLIKGCAIPVFLFR